MMLRVNKLHFITFITCWSMWCAVPGFCDGEQCIKGLYHKDKPSPESDEYKFCTPWKNLTCCTTQLDNEVALEDSPLQYNDTWHFCGNLSESCVEHWKRQECFYQCSPYVYQWKDSKINGSIKGVPICASECDDWFEACKNDMICVENVLEEKCPSKTKCVTYAEMYKNGTNLCNKMWGSSYQYVEKNGDNCMKFWFSGSKNPNANVMPVGGTSTMPDGVTTPSVTTTPTDGSMQLTLAPSLLLSLIIYIVVALDW